MTDEAKTFETRLRFLKQVFSDKDDNTTILSRCIQHKLNINLEQYEDDLKQSQLMLQNNGNPVKVLGQINRRELKNK